jgi:two-component system nitrogen regulation response regulator GlnG
MPNIHTQNLAIAKQAQTLEEDVRTHLSRYFAAHAGQLPTSGLYSRILPLMEKPLIEITLQATAGNQLKAASILGINRNTLRKKITELRIDVSEFAA